MKYVLMFVETEQYAAELEAMAPDDRDRAYALVGRWMDEHADKIREHRKLMPAHTATTVRLDRATPVVTDGPFVEGKEVVSGFVEVDVADLDEALGMARSWPGCPTVEIRPLES
ncbi:YciI family protein [Glycomyces tenuis]|uniref:YciI family protein n=1 Tax=Glycomyces tenuis TaxID=58116 RepID=UPI00041D00E0|nr:YciI family protein [Glycomyces tenuis]